MSYDRLVFLFCLYGDPADPLDAHLLAPFRNNNLTPQITLYSKAMSEVRASVELLFVAIIMFKFIDFKKQMRVHLRTFAPIATAHLSCARYT